MPDPDDYCDGSGFMRVPDPDREGLHEEACPDPRHHELEEARSDWLTAVLEAGQAHAAYLAAYREFAEARDATPLGKGSIKTHTKLRLLHDAYKIAYDRWHDADDRRLAAELRLRDLGGRAA